jgi:hypothetical protein
VFDFEFNLAMHFSEDFNTNHLLAADAAWDVPLSAIGANGVMLVSGLLGAATRFCVFLRINSGPIS